MVEETETAPVMAEPTTKVIEGKGAVGANVEVAEESCEANGVHKEANGDHEEANGVDVEVTNGVNGHEETKNGDVAVADVVEAEGGEVDGHGTTADQPEVLVEEGKSETAAEVATEIVEEETPVQPTPKVILHQFPPAKNIPSLSPFCFKMETFLRMNEIPYENQYGYKMGKKGKLPWIEYEGKRVADSKFIIKYLIEKFELNLNSDISEELSSKGHAITSMLEDNTYWALVYNRYVDNFNEFKKLSGHESGLGFAVTQKMFQRKMRSNLDGHGIGRHSRDEVYQLAADDLKALSLALGDQQYLLGDKITTYDCSVFGLCANILYSGMETPMKEFVEQNCSNIVAYCERMKNAHWSDWSDVVEVAKPEVSLKKGFSFRKKKAHAPKKEIATAEASPSESRDELSEEEKPIGDTSEENSANKTTELAGEATESAAENLTEEGNTGSVPDEVQEDKGEEKSEEIEDVKVISEEIEDVKVISEEIEDVKVISDEKPAAPVVETNTEGETNEKATEVEGNEEIKVETEQKEEDSKTQTSETGPVLSTSENVEITGQSELNTEEP